MKSLFYLAGLAGLKQFTGSADDSAVGLPAAPSPTLQQASPFPIGFAVNPTRIRDNALYRQTVEQEGGSITADVAMKPSRISNQKGTYNFGDADQLIDFAQAQNKRLHGHALVWYIDTSPSWLKQIRDLTELR